MTTLPGIKEMVGEIAQFDYVFASDHQMAYQQYTLTPESTDWVAISSPNNTKIKMLILLEGLSVGPEHVQQSI